MKRVIYAWNYVEWGGAQIHFIALIKEARKEFDIIVLLPSGTDEQFLGFLHAEDIPYRLFQGNIDLNPKFGLVAKLLRHWRRIRSEHAMLAAIRQIGLEGAVVHVDLTPAWSLFSLTWLALHAPTFITLHNAYAKVPGWRWALWNIKFAIISYIGNLHVFCTNVHAASYFRKLFAGRVSREIAITYDSIDPVEIDQVLKKPFDRAAQLQRFGVDPLKFTVLTVGQFIDRKGRWTLFDAAQKVLESNSNFSFIWVSPSLPSPKDAERLAGFKLKDSVKILRSEDVAKDRIGILSFFRTAELFVLPSFIEGVPIALLEAMALGIPCISTNVFGIPEAIINNETGLLIEAGDSDALARSMLSLFNDEQLRRRLGQGGRNRAITVFDERIAAKTALEAYKKAFDARRSNNEPLHEETI